jgi:RNA polymerase sigma factor (sigma-70 family)
VNGLSDQELLRDYAESRAEAAFGELVRRHVDHVYSAAFRMVRDPHLAEDVAQGVFLALAQSAPELATRPVLSGWLHRTAHNLAANAIRAAVRRRAREQEAAVMNELLSDADAAWEEISPHLDEALSELSEPDREALMLRYFERKSAEEMAQVLSISSEAAQKRVSRAVDRLRELFAKRGVPVGAGALVALISANAVQAAPVGLALAITTSAAATGAAAVAAATTAAKTLAMTTLQKSVLVVSLAAAIGAVSYEAIQTSRLRAQVGALQRQVASAPSAPVSASDTNAAALQQKIAALQAQNEKLSETLAQANSEKTKWANEREQARHSASLFKELADEASAKEMNSTNEYPTARHLMAGWGRLGRLSAALGRDENNLSPEEKAANKAARLNALGEIGNLMKAMKQIQAQKAADPNAPEEDPADTAACFLLGALKLDEQQFSQVYDLLGKYQQQAKQIKEDNAATDKEAAMKAFMAHVVGDVKGVVTPEQGKLLDEIMPFIHVSASGMNFNFNFGSD